MTDRSFLIHYIRVMLSEASRRRHQPSFWCFLMQAAERARKEAAKALIPASAGQIEMFQ